MAFLSWVLRCPGQWESRWAGWWCSDWWQADIRFTTCAVNCERLSSVNTPRNLFSHYEDSARKKYQSWWWLPEHVTWCCQEATQPAAGGDDQHGHAEVVIEDEGLTDMELPSLWGPLRRGQGMARYWLYVCLSVIYLIFKNLFHNTLLKSFLARKCI